VGPQIPVHRPTTSSCACWSIVVHVAPASRTPLGILWIVVTSEIWDEETAARYDADAADRFAPGVLDPTVNFLSRLAGSGAALEFAIGTGRVGIGLATRGVTVTGIELSEPMASHLRRKVDESTLPVFVGDMATTVVPGEFSLVYLVWNGISNLLTQEAQVRCFKNAAQHLSSGGRFVIELWIPPLRRLPPGQVAVPFSVGEGHLGFDTYDTVTQRCTSHHYRRDTDGTIRYETGHFRYMWPSECDLMATLAGLEFESRVADWDGSPFTSESESHVSVWRKP
jgi:SAM-dependent methyltransferase